MYWNSKAINVNDIWYMTTKLAKELKSMMQELNIPSNLKINRQIKSHDGYGPT